MSFSAMTHIAEGLCLNALLTLKVENYLICLVGIRITSVHDEAPNYAIYCSLLSLHSSWV
jgi:hypothetical protein